MPENTTQTKSPKTADEECAKMVVDHKLDSLKFYDDKFRKFNYFERLYIRGAAKRNAPRGRANLKLPIVFQQVEPFVAQMTEAMVSEAPYIEYQGRNLDDSDNAKKITDYTQYQLDDGGFLLTWTKYIRNIGKFGTGVVKPVWDLEFGEMEEEVTESRPVINPETGLPIINPLTGEPEIEEVTKTVNKPYKKFDGLKFHNVSLFDFFVPRSATSCDVQDLDWCIHRTYRTLEELIENPNYKNKKELKALLEDDHDQNTQNGTDARATPLNTRKQISLDQHRVTNKYSGKVEVLEWWGEWKFDVEDTKESDIEDGEYEPALITVAVIDGAAPILLRKDKNPFKYKFKPFVASNDYPVEESFYGYGEVDHIEGLVQESTALRNARLDVTNQGLNSMWVVERQAGVNVRNLYSAPNHVILTDDMNGLRELRSSGATSASVEELGRIDFDIQNTTEIINPRQDASNVGAAFGGTATGVQFLSARSNLRMMLKTRIQEYTFFKPLATMINQYNKQFLEDETYFRAYSEEDSSPYTNVINPNAFTTQVDYTPRSNPEKMSKDEKKAGLDYLLQVIAQIEGVQPGTTDFRVLLPQIYKLAGFPHPQKYILPEQTMVMQGQDGQLYDKNGKPVQVVPVDEQGNPQQPQPGAPVGAN